MCFALLTFKAIAFYLLKVERENPALNIMPLFNYVIIGNQVLKSCCLIPEITYFKFAMAIALENGDTNYYFNYSEDTNV